MDVFLDSISEQYSLNLEIMENRSQSPSRLAKLNSQALESSTQKDLPKIGAELHADVLALNDLPARDKPSHTNIKVRAKTISTGPPTSRHKDRNSFRFGPLAQNIIIPAHTLKSLYHSSLQVEVVYEQESMNLTGSFHIHELYINEEKTIEVPLVGPGVDLLDDAPPTLKLKLKLKAGYRPEVTTLMGIAQTWFGFMDQVESSCQTVATKIVPSNKVYLLVPAVPAATLAVVVAPIVIGLCVIFLPLFIPVLFAVLTVATCGAGTGLFLYGSTSGGRRWIQTKVPLQNLVHTNPGQALLYPTGPRPNPVSLTRLVVPSPDDTWGRLILSLLVDAIGSASYLVPVLGEVTDIAWAPLQTTVVMALYDTTTPNLKYVSFVEELLPFTDFVPSATIGWAAQFGPKLWNSKGTAKNPLVEATDLVFQEAGVSATQK